MKKFILLLFITSACFGATTFTVGSGKDHATVQAAIDECDGTPAGPYTIVIDADTYTEAFAFDTTNNAQSIALQPAVGEAVVLRTNTGFFGMRITMTSGSVSFKDMTLQSTGADDQLLITIDAVDVSLTLDGCTVGDLGDNSLIGVSKGTTGTQTAVITINNCNFLNLQKAVLATDVAELIFTNNTEYTYTASAQAANFVDLREIVSEITITDNNISTTNASQVWVVGNTGELDYDFADVQNNTFGTINSGGIIFGDTTDAAGQVHIANNTITITTSGTAQVGIRLGGDGADPGDIGFAKVLDNKVTYPGTVDSHGILIGQGVNSAYVAGNFVDTDNVAFAIKGGSVTLENNIGLGFLPCLLKGCKSPVVKNNTFVATGSKAGNYVLSIDSDGAGTNTDHATIINNNFILTDSTSVRFMDSDADGGGILNAGSHLIDNNCWFSDHALTDFANIDSETNPANFAAMQAFWATWAPVRYPNNMANGINENPQFKSVPNNDFRLRPKSPCLNQGISSLGGDGIFGRTSIGAWLPFALPEQEYRPRYKDIPLYR